MTGLLLAAPAIPVRYYGSGKTDAVIALVVLVVLFAAVALLVAYNRTTGPHHRAR